MAEVIGPCRTLPGAHHVVPVGTMCDSHPGRPASHRVQGETDSMGAELNDMCLECHEQHKVAMEAHREEQKHGMCDWCRNGADDLRQMRDFEEGMCGPVYMVCGACRERQNKELEEEMRLNDPGYYDCDPCYDSSYDEDDRDDDLDDDMSAQEMEETLAEIDALTTGPALPNNAMSPSGYPIAYVDGAFHYR
jgi:hypothetical protein